MTKYRLLAGIIILTAVLSALLSGCSAIDLFKQKGYSASNGRNAVEYNGKIYCFIRDDDGSYALCRFNNDGENGRDLFVSQTPPSSGIFIYNNIIFVSFRDGINDIVYKLSMSGKEQARFWGKPELFDPNGRRIYYRVAEGYDYSRLKLCSVNFDFKDFTEIVDTDNLYPVNFVEKDFTNFAMNDGKIEFDVILTFNDENYNGEYLNKHIVTRHDGSDMEVFDIVIEEAGK